MLLVEDTIEDGGNSGRKVTASENLDFHLTSTTNILNALNNMASFMPKFPQL